MKTASIATCGGNDGSITIKGHHREIKERSSQPRFDRRKIMPKAIRIYAGPDLDFITFPP
jgi:hypothetical protein